MKSEIVERTPGRKSSEDVIVVLDIPIEHNFALPLLLEYLEAKVTEKRGSVYRRERRDLRRRMGELAAFRLDLAADPEYTIDHPLVITADEAEMLAAEGVNESSFMEGKVIAADPAETSSRLAAEIRQCLGTGYRSLYGYGPPVQLPATA